MHGLEVEVAGGGVVDVEGVRGVCVCVGVVGARHGGEPGGAAVLLMPPDARRPLPFRSGRLPSVQFLTARPQDLHRSPSSEPLVSVASQTRAGGADDPFCRAPGSSQ